MLTTKNMVVSAISMMIFTSCGDVGREFIVQNHFSQAFEHGEIVGRKGDLDKAIVESLQFKDDQLFNYWDGVAHEFQWPDTMSVPEITSTIQQRFPPFIQDIFYDGIVIQMVRKNHGDPVVVSPLLEQYARQYFLPIHNGLRVGYWREYHENMELGVVLANQFPAAYHAALFEEFGWWVGHDAKTNPFEDLEHWESLMASENHCILVHGILRGWMMHQLEKGENVESIATPFFGMSHCAALGWRGLSWGARIHYGEMSDQFHAWQDWVRSEHPDEGRYVEMKPNRPNLWDKD